MVVGAVGTALAGILVPLGTAWLNRPPPPEDNVEEVLKALKEESLRQDREIRRLHDDVTELRSWIAGYLRATGVRVRDPEDAAPSEPVEVTAPLRKKRSPLEPAPEVRTPMPSPRPLGTAREIPEPFVPRDP